VLSPRLAQRAGHRDVAALRAGEALALARQQGNREAKPPPFDSWEISHRRIVRRQKVTIVARSPSLLSLACAPLSPAAMPASASSIAEVETGNKHRNISLWPSRCFKSWTCPSGWRR
jgi:hypothetical protein